MKDKVKTSPKFIGQINDDFDYRKENLRVKRSPKFIGQVNDDLTCFSAFDTSKFSNLIDDAQYYYNVRNNIAMNPADLYGVSAQAKASVPMQYAQVPATQYIELPATTFYKSAMIYQPSGSEIYAMTESKMYEAFKQLQTFITNFASDRLPEGRPLQVSLGDLNIANYAIDCAAQDLRSQVIMQISGWNPNGQLDSSSNIVVSVTGINRGTRQEMGSFTGYLSRTGLNESQSITLLQKMMIAQVFGRFLPYQICGQVVAVDSIRNVTVTGETAEQKRARELAVIAAAQAAYTAEQEALAQRQQEERMISESQRQTAENAYNIQQSELEQARLQEAQRLAIEANRTINTQAQNAGYAVTQQAQQATIINTAAAQREKAIADARAEAIRTEAARQKALTTALPANTKVTVGNNSVVEKKGLTDAFKPVANLFKPSTSALRLDTSTGEFVDDSGNVFAPDEVETITDEETGKPKIVAKSTPFYKKWWFWVLLILLLAGGGFGGWYYYNYTAKGKDWNDFMKDIKK